MKSESRKTNSRISAISADRAENINYWYERINDIGYGNHFDARHSRLKKMTLAGKPRARVRKRIRFT